MPTRSESDPNPDETLPKSHTSYPLICVSNSERERTNRATKKLKRMYIYRGVIPPGLFEFQPPDIYYLIPYETSARVSRNFGKTASTSNASNGGACFRLAHATESESISASEEFEISFFSRKPNINHSGASGRQLVCAREKSHALDGRERGRGREKISRATTFFDFPLQYIIK